MCKSNRILNPCALGVTCLVLLLGLTGCDGGDDDRVQIQPPQNQNPPPVTDLVWNEGNWDELNWQ